MSIKKEFLDELYARKYEHISHIAHHEKQVRIAKERVASAKTERVKKNAEADLAKWERCVDGSKDRLLHINVLIPIYLRTHGIKGEA